MKRTFCFLIALSIAFSGSFLVTIQTPASVAQFLDEIAAVQTLGIMTGNPSGDFEPEKELTRAEMSVIVCNIVLHSLSVYDGDIIFSDVPKEHWACDYVSAAFDLGIFSGYGDESFRPDSFLTYEEAVKVLIQIMGYDAFAAAKGGYPSGYMMQAVELGLLRGIDVEGGMNTAVPRRAVAKMIYNAFDIPVLIQLSFGQEFHFEKEEGRTILSEYFRSYLVYGQVFANDFSSIDGSAAASDGCVLIKDIKRRLTLCAKSGDTNAEEYLGKEIRAIVRDENRSGEYEVIFIQPEERYFKSFCLKAEEIEYFDPDTFQLVYTVRGKEDYRKINLSMALQVVENGAYTLFNGKEQLEIMSGSISFIDEDNNGIYDLALIDTYYDVVVKNISHGSGYITDYYDSSKQLKLDFEDPDTEIALIDKNNRNMTMFDIEPYTVLSIFETPVVSGQKKIKVIVSDDIVRGKIDTIENQETVTVDGTRYMLSETFMNRYQGAKYLEIGSVQTLCINFEGVICGVNQKIRNDFSDIGADYTSGMKYAYLLGASREGELDPLRFKVLTLDSKIEIWAADESLRFNAEKLDDTEIIKCLQETADGNTDVSQMVKMRLGTNGKIKQLNTAIEGNSDTIRSGSLLYLDASFEETTVDQVIAQGRYKVDENAVAFVLPVDMSNEKEMRVLSADELYMTNVAVRLYDVSSRRLASALTVNGKIVPDYSNNDDPIYAVERTVQVADEEGTIETKVYFVKKDGSTIGMTFVEGAVLQEYAEEQESLKTPSDLKSGDICRLNIDENGEVSSLRRMFRPHVFKQDPMSFSWVHGNNGDPYYSDPYESVVMRWVMGYVTDKDESFLNLNIKNPHFDKEDGVLLETFENQFYLISDTNAFGAFIILDEKEDGTFKIRSGSKDDILTKEMVGEGKESFVFTKVRYQTCSEVYVYNFRRE